MGKRMLLKAAVLGITLGVFSCGKSSGTDPAGGESKSAPKVESISPADQAIKVAVNAKVILSFSLAMDTASARAAISASPGIKGAFIWSAADTKLVWSPDSALLRSTLYTVTVGKAAKSKPGVPMAVAQVFTFTTGTDTLPGNDTVPVPDTLTTDPSKITQITGFIFRREDNASIAGANVVLYDADVGNPLQRTASDSIGKYRFRADSGNYYVGVTAMGRIASPAPGARYTPFRLDYQTTYTRHFFLRKDSSGVEVGGLTGKIAVDGLANLSGVLVIATAPDSSSYSATTGPDGVFVFNNLPIGDGYTLVAYHSGLAGDTVATRAKVALGQITKDVVLKLTVDSGRALKGQVQFLAVAGKATDITLVDPSNRLAIPDLRTFNAGGSYRMEHIPMGAYIVWGSYLNDGFVMDPDHIRKFGLPKVTYLAGDTAKVQDFAFTRAIRIVRPTNPPDSLYPVPVNSLQPWFVWEHEASTQEIVIEVFDSKGECIWGGWDSAGTIRHKQILAHPGGLDSVQFNFDSTATSPLYKWDTYSWKIYADGDRAPGIQKFIASTEDLRGLFMAGVVKIPDDDTGGN